MVSLQPLLSLPSATSPKHSGTMGKSAGTTTITFTTPVDWDGNAPGYTYVVTVEVAADGTIVNAVGQ